MREKYIERLKFLIKYFKSLGYNIQSTNSKDIIIMVLANQIIYPDGLRFVAPIGHYISEVKDGVPIIQKLSPEEIKDRRRFDNGGRLASGDMILHEGLFKLKDKITIGGTISYFHRFLGTHKVYFSGNDHLNNLITSSGCKNRREIDSFLECNEILEARKISETFDYIRDMDYFVDEDYPSCILSLYKRSIDIDLGHKFKNRYDKEFKIYKGLSKKAEKGRYENI